jgi:hypothetical protein
MIQSLGRLIVAVPGTPVRVTTNLPQPTDRYACHGVLLQALPSNVGRVYIGTSGLVRATFANVYAYLAVPTANQGPTFSAALTLAPNAVQLQDMFIDADNANDGVIVTTLVT